jgi:two-component system, NarL family, sensor histidine kinase UhpB
MTLLVRLIAKLVAIVLLCLFGAIVWVMIDADRTIERETAASADRVGRHLEGLYWQKLLWRDGLSKSSLLPSPEWKTLETVSVLSPGICVSFAPPGKEQGRVCSQVEALGPSAPAWFAGVFNSLFGPHETVRRALSVRNRSAGFVATSAVRDAALRQSWNQVSIIVSVAAALASGIAVLAALMLGHALMPAGAIIKGLRELQHGNTSYRLPRFQTDEFDQIARAANELAEDLGRTNAARAALTAQLFKVQEDERRALARDLHDEFGQCLTATMALAALIESRTPPEQEDIAEDARKIGSTQKRMLDSLRHTLRRLRSQNIEEIGLEASLRQLVSDYNSQSASRTSFRLRLSGQMATLPKQIAIDIYRICQECLTNAVKHGNPTEVRLSVERSAVDRNTVSLTVEDNGGGQADRIGGKCGYGVLGIHERIASLGGRLSIGDAAKGIRIAALIPVLEPGPREATGARA